MRKLFALCAVLVAASASASLAQPAGWFAIEKPHRVMMDAEWVRVKGNDLDPAQQRAALKNCARPFLTNSRKQYAALTAIPGVAKMTGDLAFFQTKDGLMRVGQGSKPPYFARITLEGVRNYQGLGHYRYSDETAEYWNNIQNQPEFRYRWGVTRYFAIHNIAMPDGKVGALLRDGVPEAYDPRNPGLVRSYLRCGDLQADWTAAGLQ